MEGVMQGLLVTGAASGSTRCFDHSRMQQEHVQLYIDVVLVLAMSIPSTLILILTNDFCYDEYILLFM